MTIDTLIICPCHGINMDPSRPSVHASWCGLYNYEEEGALLTEHNKVSVAMAQAQSQSLLVYSGNATSIDAGDRSEAQSYLEIAERGGWWGCVDVANRAHVEEYALDSLHNIVLSISEFARRLGYFPDRIIIVGWAFKAERFSNHIRALSWYREFTYVSINNPPKENGVLAAALAGEQQKRLALLRDPFLRGRKWTQQREARNIFAHNESYSKDVPAVEPFLRFLNGEGAYIQPPWN